MPMVIMSGIRYAPSPTFPIALSGRHIVNAQGNAMWLQGDTIWAGEAQLTDSQLVTYLDDRISKRYNAVIVGAFEHYFSSQNPEWLNAYGQSPFTNMSPVDFTSRNSAYWAKITNLFDQCKSRGIVVAIFYAYYGFNSNEGWQTALNAASSADLQNYGAYIATNYGGYGNAIFVAGGDNTSGASVDADIIAGMRSVRTDLIISGHSTRGNDAYSKYSSQVGFNLNAQYSSPSGIVGDAATCYGRSGPLPFLLVEAYYDGEHSMTPLGIRTQSYQALCSGAAGQFFGNNPIWLFGGNHNTFADDSGVDGIGAAAALSGYLSTTATDQQIYLPTLIQPYAWQLLVPKTDTSLITTSLGTGTSAIAGALSSDTSFAFIYTPSSNFTVNLAAFSKSSLRARWYDVTAGTFSAASGSPFPNSGTNAFTTPGNNAGGDPDWMLVID